MNELLIPFVASLILNIFLIFKAAGYKLENERLVKKFKRYTSQLHKESKKSSSLLNLLLKGGR
jgi:hypothetical protein